MAWGLALKVALHGRYCYILTRNLFLILSCYLILLYLAKKNTSSWLPGHSTTRATSFSTQISRTDKHLPAIFCMMELKIDPHMHAPVCKITGFGFV
jgi:hypothetical protein